MGDKGMNKKLAFRFFIHFQGGVEGRLKVGGGRVKICLGLWDRT